MQFVFSFRALNAWGFLFLWHLGDFLMAKKPTYEKLEQRVRELEEETIRRKDEAKAMRENEKRIRLLSESAFEALVIHEEGLLIEANDQFFKMFGYEEQELLGKQVIPLIVAPESIEFMKEQIRSGVKTPYDSMGIRKDGTKFPMEINARPVEYQGRTVRVGAIRDLSERKRAEQTLRESEEKYRELANSLPQIVFEMNKKGKLIFANRNAFDIFGYTKTDFEKDLNALQMVIPEDRDRAMENIQKAMSGEPLGGIEYTALTKNGDTFPIVIHSNRILQKDKTAGLRGIIIDLTERKRTEKALWESEEKYRTILESIEDGYYEVDLAGNFTFFNDSICKFFGYSRDELLGMNNRQYMDEKNAKKFFQAFNSVFRIGKPYKGIDCEVIRKDGSRCYVEASVSLRRDSEGQPIGFQGIVRDISERKKAEEDKAKLEAQLLQAQKMEAIGT